MIESSNSTRAKIPDLARSTRPQRRAKATEDAIIARGRQAASVSGC